MCTVYAVIISFSRHTVCFRVHCYSNSNFNVIQFNLCVIRCSVPLFCTFVLVMYSNAFPRVQYELLFNSLSFVYTASCVCAVRIGFVQCVKTLIGAVSFIICLHVVVHWFAVWPLDVTLFLYGFCTVFLRFFVRCFVTSFRRNKTLFAKWWRSLNLSCSLGQQLQPVLFHHNVLTQQRVRSDALLAAYRFKNFKMLTTSLMPLLNCNWNIR